MSAHPQIPDEPAPEVKQDDEAGVPAFSFPFNPAAFAGAAKKAATYPGAGKSNHDKTPSRAPNGSRRSMGKR